MGKEIWFISDTHFGHAATVNKFEPARPFSSVEEMDETMVERWNDRVRPQDRVYHLGDVVMNRRCLKILERLNGKKVLIKGNHDIFKLSDFTPFFEDIRAYKMFPRIGLVCSHIPIHPEQLEHRFRFNVHGHMHFKTLDDPRYVNVCVEHTGYAPISLCEVLNRTPVMDWSEWPGLSPQEPKP